MKKNMLRIIIANLFYMIIVAGTNFVLPKFTSVETYAAVKDYTLYITTYAGILTLGYTQGMYIRYGGKKTEELTPADVGMNVFTFFCLMLPVSIGVTIFGLVTNNFLFSLLGVGLLSTNINSYFQLFYQATGDFKSYSLALNASRILVFVGYATLLFGFQTDNPIFLVAVSPASSIITTIWLTIVLHKRVPFLKHLRFGFGMAKSNIRVGAVLMLGDFMSRFLLTLDRWMVKYLLGTFSFAVYSFAVSLENMVNTFMSPVTVSMYNTFCKNPDQKRVRVIKDATLIYGFFIIAGAYPAKFILEHFMTNYIDSIQVIFPLFAAQAFACITRGIYVNRYKAEGKQNKYMWQTLAMLGVSAVLHVIFYLIYPSILTIALATLVTNILWLIWCEFRAPGMRYSPLAVLTVTLLLGVYLYTGFAMNSIVGCVVYGICGVAFGFLFMRKSFLYVIRSCLGFLKRKKKAPATDDGTSTLRSSEEKQEMEKNGSCDTESCKGRNISLVPHNRCFGCSACAEICPKGAIRMEADALGFLRPHLDETLCVNCGLCVNACDAHRPVERTGKKPACYAVKHMDPDEVATSRSGGFFMALCRHIIDAGGVVFGCQMKDMRAVHTYEETYEGCIRFKGSKYVQSDMGDSFSRCADFLRAERLVLFSGTGCQVHGLLRYLEARHISRDRLVTVDIVCHGVPSPGALAHYIAALEMREGKKVAQMDFRDKAAFGWQDHVETYVFEDGSVSHMTNWTEMFYRHILFRPSCYECKYTTVERLTDFTIADYWGIGKNAPRFDDNRGVSLVMVHSEKGKETFEAVRTLLDAEQTNLETSYQPQMKQPIWRGWDYKAFTRAWRKNPQKATRKYFFPGAGMRFVRAVEKRGKRLIKKIRKIIKH